tara:strand:+ start:605 stop:1159 length:555 start_codon:yes stop_codon:yes gene_type:complete
MTPKKKQPSDLRIIDNWLSTSEFLVLKDIFTSTTCNWFVVNGISDNTETMKNLNPLDNYMFAHMVYQQYSPSSQYWEKVTEIIHPKLKETCGQDFRVITRIKCNMYPRTPEVVQHPWHTDSSEIKGMRGLLLSFNTCDGYTGFADGTEVDSVENRAVLFDSTEKHYSTSCSNASYRLNMNINYV